MFWKNHFFTADFSDVASFLSEKEAGYEFQDQDAEILAAELQNHDPREKTKHQWAANTPQRGSYNVTGTVVSYNGANSEYMPTNSKYTHVMVLRILEAESPDDRLFLHYNV